MTGSIIYRSGRYCLLEMQGYGPSIYQATAESVEINFIGQIIDYPLVQSNLKINADLIINSSLLLQNDVLITTIKQGESTLIQ